MLFRSSGAPAAAANFAAYGVVPTADDPLSIALHRLINETGEQARLIEALVAALKAHGISIECPADTHEKFDPNTLNRLVD